MGNYDKIRLRILAIAIKFIQSLVIKAIISILTARKYFYIIVV